jgi:hypothetical protein
VDDPVIKAMMKQDYKRVWGEEHYPVGHPTKGMKHKTNSKSRMRMMVQMTPIGKMRTHTRVAIRTRTRPTSLPDNEEAAKEKTDVPVSDEVPDDDADGADDDEDDNEDASEEGGEPDTEDTKMGGRKYKKSNSFDKMFVEIFSDLFKYFAAHGDTNVRRGYITAEGHHLGNCIHDQRKTYHSGVLTNSRTEMLALLNFQFQKQRNVVVKKILWQLPLQPC